MGKAPIMCHGGVLMVGTMPSMGTSAALCSFPLVLFRSKGCSARLLKRDKCANGVEGVLRYMGRPAWSLLRESLSAHTSMLDLSWEDSWLMPPWQSFEISSNPCSYTHCASFALSSLGLVGLKGLQILPDGRIVPEARDNTGSVQKAVSPGLTLMKHCLFFSGYVEPWAPALCDCSPVARVFFLFHTHDGCFCPRSLTWECGC